jgi:hypothetical protein
MEMKINLVCLIILCLSASTLYAQEETASDGFLNVGVGILPGIGASVSYDYKLTSIQNNGALTIGGYMGYSRRDGYDLDGGSGVDFWESKSLLSPRIGYTCLLSRKVGIYGTAMPGVSIERLHFDRTEYSFFAGFSAGVRVQLVRKLYLFAEGGYNVLCVNGGISFAF